MLGIFRQEFIISAKDTVDKNNETINIVLSPPMIIFFSAKKFDHVCVLARYFITFQVTLFYHFFFFYIVTIKVNHIWEKSVIVRWYE